MLISMVRHSLKTRASVGVGQVITIIPTFGHLPTKATQALKMVHPEPLVPPAPHGTKSDA